MGRRQPAQQAIPWSYPGHSPGHGWAARGLYPPLDIVVLPPCPKSLDLRISHTGGNINCPMHFIRLQIKLYTTNPDQRDQRTHLAIVVAGTGEERTLPGEEEPWDSERCPCFRLPGHAVSSWIWTRTPGRGLGASLGRGETTSARRAEESGAGEESRLKFQ